MTLNAPAEGRSRPQDARAPRLLQAAWHHAGAQPRWRWLFLPMMALALMAVQELATQTNGAFLWIPGLAQRDPLFILPLIFGVLITLYLDLAFATDAKRRAMIWVVALPLMTATGALFAAGADIYLITSATLLVVQRLWVSGEFARLWQAWRRSRTPEGHHRARGRVAAGELRQQGVPPRPDARGRHAGAGWRRADARLHDADGRRARVDPPPRAWLDLAAARQRAACGPQFGQRRGRRQPQLRRRVRVGDRRRPRRTGSRDRPRPGILRSRTGVELRLLGRRRQHPDPAHGRCRILRRSVHAGSFGRRPCHDRDGAGHRGKPGVRHGAAADLPVRPRHQEAVRQGRRADRSWSAAGNGRRRRASVRRPAGHGMGLSRWALPPRAEPRHHPAGGR